jgi:hypothetical protein
MVGMGWPKSVAWDANLDSQVRVGCGTGVAQSSLPAESSVARRARDGYRACFAYMSLWGLGARGSGKSRDMKAVGKVAARDGG